MRSLGVIVAAATLDLGGVLPVPASEPDPASRRDTTADERFADLFGAVSGIAAELDPEAVPGRLLAAATAATDADGGAIGRRVPNGRWRLLASSGLNEADVARLADPPPPDAAPHTGAAGPSEGPAPSGGEPAAEVWVTSGGALLVPVRFGDSGPATLVLARRAGFEPSAARLLPPLADAAHRAIVNGRLFERVWEQAQVLESTAEIVRALADGAGHQVVLDGIARWARRITDAEVAGVAIPDGDDLVVAAGDGPWAERLRGLRVPGAGTAAETALRDRRAMVIEDLTAPAASIGIHLPFGPGLIAPMGRGVYFQGVVAATNTTAQAPVDRSKIAPLAAFAERAGLALELAGRRRDAEGLVRLAERERIATGLHNAVVRRLFDVASTLSATAALVTQREAARRLRQAIDQVDRTIADIRATVFD